MSEARWEEAQANLEATALHIPLNILLEEDAEDNMEYKCKICDRDFESEQSLSQHNQSKHAHVETKINYRKYFLIGIAIAIVVLVSFSAYSYSTRPGKFNEFAKCLTEKGAVVYGNDFCSYTAKQLNYFGNSQVYLNYTKCIDHKKLCDDKGITITPTWEINGSYYTQVQTFERLSEITGCKIV